MIRAGGSQIWNLTNSCETVAKVDIRGAEYETFIVEKRVVAADTLEVIAQPTFGPSEDQPLAIIRVEYEVVSRVSLVSTAGAALRTTAASFS